MHHHRPPDIRSRKRPADANSCCCSYESTHETGIRNLYVIKACQSLTSRGYVKTQFSWQYYYYTLTPEGLDYLREWLHIPAEIVPATHIKQQRSHAPPRGMMGGDDRGERRFGGRGRGDRGDREGGYRRREAGEGKEGGAPSDFAPQL
jgi:small subunit ribosomal protein S10e